MYVEVHRTPACYGSVAVPRRQADKGAQRPCAGAVAGAVLDTLAQPCQRAQATLDILRRRARSKYLSLPLATRLAELRSPLEKSYRNTIYCASTLRQNGGKLQGKYCGNRWCLVCNRVRTARAISRYKPVLDQWREPMFVTLTVRNVGGDQLAETIGEMLARFAAASRGITRTDGLSFEALRKLECTHSYHRGDYHPHFHALVNGRAAAEALRTRWLAAWGDQADAQAQDVRAATPGSAHELFKYFTKLASSAGGKKQFIPVEALDTIFRAMRGRRVWQPVGFTATPQVDEEAQIGTDGTTEALTPVADGTEWAWEQDQHDWVDHRTGELLTGWEPNRAAESFVTHFTPHPSPGHHGNQSPTAAAQAGGAQAGAAPAGGTGTPRSTRTAEPVCPGRRPERAAGSGNGGPDDRRHCPAPPGGRNPPGSSLTDARGRHALEPGSEIVCGRMGGGTLKAFPAPGMIDAAYQRSFLAAPREFGAETERDMRISLEKSLPRVMRG